MRLKAIKFSLPVLFLKENNKIIAYTPGIRPFYLWKRYKPS